MLTKWIVETYKTLVEIALWAFILIGGLVGALTGSVADHGFLGFVIGAATCFFGMAIFFGAALILQDIHERVGMIESQLNKCDGSNFSSSRVRQTQATKIAGHQQNSSRSLSTKSEIECKNCGAVYRGEREGSVCECGMRLK